MFGAAGRSPRPATARRHVGRHAGEALRRRPRAVGRVFVAPAGHDNDCLPEMSFLLGTNPRAESLRSASEEQRGLLLLRRALVAIARASTSCKKLRGRIVRDQLV